MLDNLLLPCVNTAREGGAEKALCCDTVAAAGAGAELLTCSTVGTCSGRRRVIPVCYLVTVTALRCTGTRWIELYKLTTMATQ